jgi:hypothetical protein
VTQGADNFETMPEVEAPKSSAREQELFNIVYDKTLDRKQAVKKRHRRAYLDLIEKRPIGAEERRALIELGREYTGILQQLIDAVEIPGVSKGDTYAKLDAYAEIKGIAYTDRRAYNYAEAAPRAVIQDILKSGPNLDERRTRADFVRHVAQEIAAFEQAAQKQSAPSMEKVKATAPPQAATTPANGTAQRQSVLDAAEEAQRLDAQGGPKRSAAAMAADERLAETIRSLISNEYQGVEDVTRSDKPRRQWTVKERELNSLIDRLETLQSAKKRTRSMTAATAQSIRETTRSRLIDEMRRRIETDSRIKPTTPREQLTETAREVTQGADNFETMPEVESAPRSRVAFREKVEELKRLEDALIDFTNGLARPQGLTKEQEKAILDEMQAEIAKKRDELTEGFTRPQSSEELRQRLESFLPKLKGLDYSRVEGYRLYIDKEHKAPLRAQIKELMGTGLNISPTNLKNYGLNVAGSFKDMVRLLFALENDAKGTPRGHLTPSRLYGMDHETASWHDIVDATGQGDLSGRKLKDLDLSEIQTSIDFYVSILESYKDDPKTYKRFRRRTDKRLRDLRRYVRTRKAEGRIKGERPPAPPESKPTPTPTVDLTQQEKRDALLSLMPTTAREQLTETAREVTQGADNFETMPDVESAEDRTRGDLKSKQQALDLLRRSEQEDELKGRQRAKGAGAADKALMRAVREILKRPDPTQDLDERDRQRLRDSLFSLEEAQRPNKYMNAQRSKEKRQRARDTIKEILDQQVRMISEALNPTPIPQTPTPAPEPPTPSPAREQLTETVRELTAPSSPLNIDQANAQDTLTETRTRNPESKAADKALIESARELAKTSERGEEIKSAVLDLMNAQQLKRYKRATGDMSARAEDMIEKRREARERLRSATSGEVINNFETMPETEAQPKKRSGPDISRYKRALSLAKKAERLDKLKNNRRSKASREADQALIELAQDILEKDLGDVEVRTIYRKPSTMWTREESLKVAIGAMAGELKTRQRALGGRGGAEQAQELRADAREKLIDAIQEHVDRFLPDEVIDARLDRDLARDARETAKQEAREAQEARQYQQKTFTPEIQSAIESLKSRHFATRGKSYPLETYLKTRKDGGIYRTTETPAELADRIAENLPDNLANLYDFREDTLRALITKAINEGVEARETPAELKDRIGSVITQRAQDNAASQKAQITGEGQSKALREMKRNIQTLSGDGYFDEYRRGGERSYMGLGAIEKTLDMSERLDNLYVDAIFRQALPPELERFKAPISRFEPRAADQVAIAFANKYETVGEIRDNISTIREQMRATIKNAVNKTADALAGNPYTLRLINQSYEKATERLNTDRQKNIENARALAQYTDDPQAHLAEIQELERQSDQAIAEQMEINSEFARAYIHEASDLVERALETTKGEVIDNVMSVKTPKHANKFTASVQGKANRKLMARIFNEVFEQVTREVRDEPIERGEKHPRNIADTVKKPSKTPAQFRGDIERADEEKRERALAEREARRARRTQKSANHLINYRAQLLQTIERIA